MVRWITRMTGWPHGRWLWDSRWQGGAGKQASRCGSDPCISTEGTISVCSFSIKPRFSSRHFLLPSSNFCTIVKSCARHGLLVPLTVMNR